MYEMEGPRPASLHRPASYLAIAAPRARHRGQTPE